ncbi:MAG: hypothetical protein DBY37_01900 [Desulfovibrionaceae bacterium]|nr:MAG: hypothetical protein DBY37_12745 [Desulfovibrionaceae bacterium]PWL64580.1 MAG: hypothetical protein DBY37_01900 [Desulfovibrionaceae bacterium]
MDILPFLAYFLLVFRTNKGGSMNINTELERLRATEQLQREAGGAAAQSAPAGDFGALLARQMGRGTASGPSPDALRALGDPLRLANLDVMTLGDFDGAERNGTDDSLVEALTGGLSTTLDSVDRYASMLSGRNADALKSAYGELDALDSSLAELRRNLGRLSRAEPELEGMVNELEVLAAAERIKFDRGDYL